LEGSDFSAGMTRVELDTTRSLALFDDIQHAFVRHFRSGETAAASCIEALDALAMSVASILHQAPASALETLAERLQESIERALRSLEGLPNDDETPTH
jgi:hypothetical protein